MDFDKTKNFDSVELELTELESGTHSVGTRRDGDNVLRVFNRHDNTGSKDQLLPGLANVQNVNTIASATPDVLFHLRVRVSRSSVDCRRSKIKAGQNAVDAMGTASHDGLGDDGTYHQR